MTTKVSAESVSYFTVNKLITKYAKQKNIPPEVAKAVAYKESGWHQWKENGEPLIKEDRDGKEGIGIMQITDDVCAHLDVSNCDYELKNNIDFNIKTGLDILNQKWDYAYGDHPSIPSVNDGNKSAIESWYFPVMAYNGTYEINSPIFQKTGKRNYASYQDQVFALIKDSGDDKTNFNPGMSLVDLPMKNEDFTYDSEDHIHFHQMHYSVDQPLTRSRQMYHEGDQAYLVKDGTTVKKQPNDQTGRKVAKQIVTILESEVHYDTSGSTANNDTGYARHWVRYHVQLENGTKGYVASSLMEPVTTRLSGDNRIKTAVEVSKEGWISGAETVIISRDDEFPDALTGAPLAYKEDAPILLTDSEHLSPETKEEIQRLGAHKAIILGGSENAVQTPVKTAIEALGLQTERIAGATRFETAAKIADRLGSDQKQAIVANGNKFADALSAAPYAARKGIPILLTTKSDKVPSATKQALSGIQKSIVVGGSGVVSDLVLQDLPGGERVPAGKERYTTSAEFVDAMDVGNEQAYVATGQDFPDALTGAVLAAKRNAPLLLVKYEKVLPVTENLIKSRKIDDFVILGGHKSAVSNDVKDDLSNLAENLKQ